MPRKSKKGEKKPMFRCKYGHVRCEGGKDCEDAMQITGRPSDWTPKMNRLLVEFFKKPFAKEWVSSSITKFDKDTGKKIYEKHDKQLTPETVPFFSAFEREHGLYHGSLSVWAKPENLERYPGFSDAYNKAKELQKEFLIQNGMSGLSPASAFCFTAKNLTDMRDQRDIGGPGGGPLVFGWADDEDDDFEADPVEKLSS